MRASSLALLLSCTISYFLSFAHGSQVPTIPACASKCWENSKFVTYCGRDSQCLCADVVYQNTVFLCLNSQCQTAQYAPALHYTLAQCSKYDLKGLENSPPLLRGTHGQQQPEYDYSGYRSASILPTATRSLRRRFMTASATASVRPSRTPAYGSVYGSIVRRVQATPPPYRS